MFVSWLMLETGEEIIQKQAYEGKKKRLLLRIKMQGLCGRSLRGCLVLQVCVF